jgi:hypothetical protein
MSFHLEGPWLSTTGKKKGPKKWASAEAKRKSQQAEETWSALLKRQGIETETRKKSRALTSGVLTTGPRIPPGRETVRIASLDTGMVACTKKEDMRYSGSAVLGIAVQHKSCLQPIFNEEAAKDSASMRR